MAYEVQEKLIDIMLYRNSDRRETSKGIWKVLFCIDICLWIFMPCSLMWCVRIFMTQKHYYSVASLKCKSFDFFCRPPKFKILRTEKLIRNISKTKFFVNLICKVISYSHFFFCIKRSTKRRNYHEFGKRGRRKTPRNLKE